DQAQHALRARADDRSRQRRPHPQRGALIMRKPPLLSVALVATLGAAGCIDVNPEDHVYGCSQDSDCPSGQLCDHAVNTCARPGHFVSDQDLSMSGGDHGDMAMTLPPGDYPSVTIRSPVVDDTTGVNVAIKFEADKNGATFHCRLDGSSYADCTSPWSLSNLK